MTFFQILSAALVVAVLYFLIRAALIGTAKRELARMGAEWDETRIVLCATADSLEYALRCALLAADGRSTVIVSVPSRSADREELMDIIARFSLRHQNLRYQMI